MPITKNIFAQLEFVNLTNVTGNNNFTVELRQAIESTGYVHDSISDQGGKFLNFIIT